MVTTVPPHASCEGKIYDATPLSMENYFDNIKGQRILDIGCGTGNLGVALASRGNECYGLTVSEREAQLARTKLHQVITGDVETMQALPFPDHFFDVVTLFDVLEHLKNPSHALQLIKPYLKPNGSIIASIPNVANIVIRFNLLRGRFDYQEFGIMDNTHLRFFTMKTAKNLLVSAGYIVRDVKFTNQNWYFPKLLVPFYEWEIRQRVTRWWPTLFATQFVLYATLRSDTFPSRLSHAG